MVAETMAEAGLAFSALEGIAVTLGPGSFTGVRVGLAFAKGLSLALTRPCIGVSTLRALAGCVPGGDRRAAVIDGGRALFFQLFDGAVPRGPPEPLSRHDAAERMRAEGPVAVLIGPCATDLAAELPAARAIDRIAPSPEAIATLARTSEAGALQPLYMRAPDARAKA